jgi:hypothetical protein
MCGCASAIGGRSIVTAKRIGDRRLSLLFQQYSNIRLLPSSPVYRAGLLRRNRTSEADRPGIAICRRSQRRVLVQRSCRPAPKPGESSQQACQFLEDTAAPRRATRPPPNKPNGERVGELNAHIWIPGGAQFASSGGSMFRLDSFSSAGDRRRSPAGSQLPVSAHLRLASMAACVQASPRRK